jgi:hypothetical protein
VRTNCADKTRSASRLRTWSGQRSGSSHGIDCGSQFVSPADAFAPSQTLLLLLDKGPPLFCVCLCGYVERLPSRVQIIAKLKFIDQLRPQCEALTLMLVVALGEAQTETPEPWPLK